MAKPNKPRFSSERLITNMKKDEKIFAQYILKKLDRCNYFGDDLDYISFEKENKGDDETGILTEIDASFGIDGYVSCIINDTLVGIPVAIRILNVANFGEAVTLRTKNYDGTNELMKLAMARKVGSLRPSYFITILKKYKNSVSRFEIVDFAVIPTDDLVKHALLSIKNKSVKEKTNHSDGNKFVVLDFKNMDFDFYWNSIEVDN